MNYIIEGGVDFADLLNETACKEDAPEEKYCLLTGEKLDLNPITLACGHTFSYKALYDETYSQKFKMNAYYSTTYLRINQIQCPYCRTVTNQLMPYIPCIEGVHKIKGVNSPEHYCMKYKQCSHVFKSGKNKGQQCRKSAFTFSLDKPCLCATHWLYNKRRLDKKKQALDNVSELSQDNKIKLLSLSKKYTMVELKKILRENKLILSGNKNDLILRLINGKIF